MEHLPGDLALAMLGITKKFGDFSANDHVDVLVKKGTVHAIVGENGAGKSTVIKILCGFYKMDQGEIRINGKVVNIQNTTDSIALGVGTVHQHFMLVNAMTVLDNIILGSYPVYTPMITDYKALRKRIEGYIEEYQLAVDLDGYVSDLSVGVKQRVEILKAVFRNAQILVFDEPSAVLTPLEVESLFQIIRKVKAAGKTVIIITHKLHEVMEISDEVTVMRAGKVVSALTTKNTTIEELSGLMVGHFIEHQTKPPQRKGETIFEVKDVSLQRAKRELLKNISFSVSQGEIVGIAGISGNGQVDLENLLAGLYEKGVSGDVLYKGKSILKLDAKAQRVQKIAHVPADRIESGFVPDFSNLENAVLGYHSLPRFTKKKVLLSFPAILRYTQSIIELFDVRPRKASFLTKKMSGGNQQKLIVGRELETSPDFLMIAEPTRGVDIGAIELIHQKIFEARARGVAILLFSSELAEIKKLSDRSFVMYKGQIVAEIDWKKNTEKQIGMMMIGDAVPQQLS